MEKQLKISYVSLLNLISGKRLFRKFVHYVHTQIGRT